MDISGARLCPGYIVAAAVTYRDKISFWHQSSGTSYTCICRVSSHHPLTLLTEFNTSYFLHRLLIQLSILSLQKLEKAVNPVFEIIIASIFLTVNNTPLMFSDLFHVHFSCFILYCRLFFENKSALDEKLRIGGRFIVFKPYQLRAAN